MDAFTRMMWREVSSVAFGIKDKYVFAWYCTPLNVVKANAVGVKDSEQADEYKKNVYPSCL